MSESPNPTPGPPKPVCRVRRGKPRPRTPTELRDYAEASYVDAVIMEVRLQEVRRQEDIRRRVDGQPSAQSPQAVLPLKLWATVQEDPSAEDDPTEVRLANYERWLKSLKQRGLYDGPVTLTRVTPPADDATGGATSGAS
jgi:hypothetical protein